MVHTEPHRWKSSQVNSCQRRECFQARCCIKLIGDLTPLLCVFYRSFLGKKAAACAPSLLPRSTNAIFICSSLQLLKLPPGTSWYFSPPCEPLNTMSFMPRGENKRVAWSVNPTMWRTCSIFCAWSLLFLTEVCAQSQRRYTFIHIYFNVCKFFKGKKNFMSEQVSRIPYTEESR